MYKNGDLCKHFRASCVSTIATEQEKIARAILQNVPLCSSCVFSAITFFVVDISTLSTTVLSLLYVAGYKSLNVSHCRQCMVQRGRNEKSFTRRGCVLLLRHRVVVRNGLLNALRVRRTDFQCHRGWYSMHSFTINVHFVSSHSSWASFSILRYYWVFENTTCCCYSCIELVCILNGMPRSWSMLLAFPTRLKANKNLQWLF